MAKSWCKVSASLDGHPRIRRAGNLGRQVFEFALRRNAEIDKNGVIPAEHMEPEYLADVLMLTTEDAVTGLSGCVRTRLLTLDGDHYVICGWDDDWGKHPMTEAERKRVQRAKTRNDSMSRECPDTNVTESDRPECHGSEERRGEEKRSEERESGAPAAPVPVLALAPLGKPKRSKRPHVDASDSERQVAAAVLGRLTEASGVAYKGADPHVRLIAARLREGITEGQLRAVVAFCADSWKGDDKMHAFLRPETLFGPETIHKYLAPASARYSKAIADLERQQAMGGQP